MFKNRVIWFVILAFGIVVIGAYFGMPDIQRMLGAVSTPLESPRPLTESSSVSPSATPILAPDSPPARKSPNVAQVPLPTSDGRTTFMDESVPWSLLLANASCELKGEIKFLNHNTYDNQDAIFVYKGIDNPARNIFWTVTPQDNVSVGPNIFSKMYLPDGENLLGIVLPQNPKYKQYEITAKIQYGRLVDDKGNFVIADGHVKVFEKQCAGKTTVVLP